MNNPKILPLPHKQNSYVLNPIALTTNSVSRATVSQLPDIRHAGRGVSALLPRFFISQSDPRMLAADGPFDSVVVNHRKWQRCSQTPRALGPRTFSQSLSGSRTSVGKRLPLHLLGSDRPVFPTRWYHAGHVRTGVGEANELSRAGPVVLVFICERSPVARKRHTSLLSQIHIFPFRYHTKL